MPATKRASKKGSAKKAGGAAKKGGARKGGAKKGATRGAARGISSVLSGIGSIAGAVGSVTGGRRDLRVGASRNAGLNEIVTGLRKKFRELGCPGCRSGIDRIILEDIVSGGGPLGR